MNFFKSRDAGKDRFGWVLRESLDYLLDGVRTGRWHYTHLSPTEKRHLGTIIEIRLAEEFEIVTRDGTGKPDWVIQEVEIDCKFSRQFGGWMIPRQMYTAGFGTGTKNSHALVIWMNDDESTWAAGVIKVMEKRLVRHASQRSQAQPQKGQGDKKRYFTRAALKQVRWLFVDGDSNFIHQLPKNQLCALGEAKREKIRGKKSGQERAEELFRIMEGEIVERSTILTVGQQLDSMKRARDARPTFRKDGMLLLGSQAWGPALAEQLHLERPRGGQVLPIRVTKVLGRNGRYAAHINGELWSLARKTSKICEAPVLPKEMPKDGWEAYFKKTP